MICAINFFDDPQQVAENSKESFKAYLDSVFKGNNQPVGGEDEQKPNADRLQADESDQVSNSPNVDGMTTE
jgi:pyocin large subunit-like protein